jgi:hypothetical protein
MIPLLAQSSVPVPAEIASWLACLACVLWIISLVKKIRAPALTQPLAVKSDAAAPLVTAGAPRYVEKPEFTSALDQVHGRIKRERAEIDAQFGKLDTQLSQMRGEQRQDNLGEEARATRLNERIDELDKRIDAIPQRVLELLNTARQYHNR